MDHFQSVRSWLERLATSAAPAGARDDPGAGDEGGHSWGRKMTWAQSIANEKLSIFAEATRGAKAHWNTVGTPELSVLLAESASKVWVSQVWAERGMDTRQEAEADSGCEFKHSIILMSMPIQKSQNRSRRLALWHTNVTRFLKENSHLAPQNPKFFLASRGGRSQGQNMEK